MNFEIKNKSTRDFSKYTDLLKSLMKFSKKQLGWDQPVSLIFLTDPENGKKPLGKTAHYVPSERDVAIFCDNRHIKDIMRSISHELVHHKQNCEDRLTDLDNSQLGYAQEGKGRELEKEAYQKGNMVFRDWEDNLKEKRNQDLYSGKLHERFNFEFNPYRRR